MTITYRKDVNSATGQVAYIPSHLDPEPGFSPTSETLEGDDPKFLSFVEENPGLVTDGPAAPVVPTNSAASTAENTRSAYDLLLEYAPQLAEQELALQEKNQPRTEALRASDRTADISDVQSLLSRLQAIQRDQLTPEEQQLKDLLSGQITSDLALGQTLSPEQARVAEQAARTAEGARGISAGRGSANREAVRKALEGRKLQTERQGAASSYLAQSAAERFDPFQAILGRPATAASTTPTGTAAASNLVETGNRFAQQDIAQDKYNLSLQLAQNLAGTGTYGF